MMRFIKLVLRAAQVGIPLSCCMARAVSMPSAIQSFGPARARRMAPPVHRPSIIFGFDTDAFLRPSLVKYVRWIPLNLPSGAWIPATIAGNSKPVGPCFKAG